MKAKRRIIIVGGGVSGCFAAIAAAKKGALPIIYERNDSILKKLLVTGNGRCNISNDILLDTSKENVKQFYWGSFGEKISDVYKEFGLSETRKLLKELGIELKNRGELLYPYSDQASSVKKAICMELDYLGVIIKRNMKVTGISKAEAGYNLVVCDETTGKMVEDFCDAVILAMGSRAMPSTGSDGFSAKMFKKLNINYSRYLPALTRCISRDEFVRDLAGIRCNGKVSLYSDDVFVMADEGEIQFVKDGVSGIVTFQISSVAARLYSEGHKLQLDIDFFPNLEMSKVESMVNDRLEIAKCKNRSIGDSFCGLLNEKLIPVIVKRENIANALKHFKVNVDGFGDFESCQVCSGGIDAKAIGNNLELVEYKGLYACGENIDADGKCGGFNLQFAISTGYLAGRNAASEGL